MPIQLKCGYHIQDQNLLLLSIVLGCRDVSVNVIISEMSLFQYEYYQAGQAFALQAEGHSDLSVLCFYL